MKKVFISFCFGTLLLASCGGIESDAEKIAKLQCEIRNLKKPSKEKAFKMFSEMRKMEKEFKSKYKDRYQEFQKAKRKAYEKCN